MNKLPNIKERILNLVKAKRISYETFFPQIGMTYASFRGNAKKTPLNSNAIENILTIFPDLNPTWLLTGNGEMLLDFTKGITGGENPDTDREFSEISNELGVLGTLLHANKNVKEVSDKFDEIRGKLIVIETYTKQYELLNRMIPILTCYSRKQVKMNDVKEEFKANIEVLSEMVSILEPYSEYINELFEKLSEFDNQHDKIFLIEE